MAAEGMRFNNVLSAPVCSPTRGMFLTGKYNFRIGLPDITGRGGAVKELDVKNNVTLPQLLQKAGYVTAMAGKWHLKKGTGGEKMDASLKDNPSPHITDAGFESQYQHENGLAFSAYLDAETGQFKADWIQSWVLKFLKEQAGKDKPFFLYYAHPMPHSPWCKTPDSKRTYDNPGKSGLAYFGDHVAYLDKRVGQMIEKVKELGIADNTLIMFSGDNGSEGSFTVMADGSHARAGKFGFGQNARVPLIAWWPGTIPAGAVRDDLVDTTDFLPTLLVVAGVPLPGNAGIDGVSFRDALLGKLGSARDWIMSYRLGAYVIRDQRYGLREDGRLYDLTGGDFDESVVGEGTTVKMKFRLS
jgi:arylsulfatase A